MNTLRFAAALQLSTIPEALDKQRQHEEVHEKHKQKRLKYGGIVPVLVCAKVDRQLPGPDRGSHSPVVLPQGDAPQAVVVREVVSSHNCPIPRLRPSNDE